MKIAAQIEAPQTPEPAEPSWREGDVVTIGGHTLLRGPERWSCTCGVKHTDTEINNDRKSDIAFAHVLRDGKPVQS